MTALGGCGKSSLLLAVFFIRKGNKAIERRIRRLMSIHVTRIIRVIRTRGREACYGCSPRPSRAMWLAHHSSDSSDGDSDRHHDDERCPLWTADNVTSTYVTAGGESCREPIVGHDLMMRQHFVGRVMFCLSVATVNYYCATTASYSRFVSYFTPARRKYQVEQIGVHTFRFRRRTPIQ